MALSRRDFMKLVGVSIASLAVTHCRPPISTCYAPLPPSLEPTEPVTARGRLQKAWLSFDALAQATLDAGSQGTTENTFGQNLVAGHRLALDELLVTGELTTTVADLVQEAYEAAVYHVWRSNTPMTCYEPAMINYSPTSAEILVQQAQVLDELAEQGTIDPDALDKARTALEHDLAFYALTDEEVDALYESIVNDWQTLGQSMPGFEDLALEVPPEAEEAANFILVLLSSR